VHEKYKHRHNLSTVEYLVSVSKSLLLTKYTTHSFCSNSRTRADPIAYSLADKYNLNGLLSRGGIKTGGDFR
jgi:hypothetical protein